jgi:hypothetical protein
VLDGAWSGHRGGDVHHRGHHGLAHVMRDGRRVFDSVLQAEDDSVRLQQRRQFARNGVGIGRLDAEEDQIRAMNRSQFDASVHAKRLGLARHVEFEPVALDGLHVLRATDQDYTSTSPCEHRAIEAADGPGAHDSNLLESGCHGKRC